MLGPYFSLLQAASSDNVDRNDFLQKFLFLRCCCCFNVKPSSLPESIRARQLLCDPELGDGGKKVGELLASSFLPQCPVLGWLVLIMIIWGNWSLPQVKVLTLNITRQHCYSSTRFRMWLRTRVASGESDSQRFNVLMCLWGHPIILTKDQ